MLITRIADLHFAATEGNRETLLQEGIEGSAIVVTGNPIIDALKQITASSSPIDTAEFKRLIRPLPKKADLNLPDIWSHNLRAA